MIHPNFTPFPTITTERLTLREITDEDLPEIFYQRSDPQIMKYIDRAPAQSMDDAQRFITVVKTALASNDGITWGIVLKDSSKLIGNIGLWRIIKEHHRAELGYALHPEHQSRGYATEAMKAVLQYGFGSMQLHSVEANVNPSNVASIKLLERNGFVKEAHFKEDFYFDGKFLDSAIYSLLAPK
jgi:ribosomal-protein-alanine N-acetyltransferase